MKGPLKIEEKDFRNNAEVFFKKLNDGRCVNGNDKMVYFEKVSALVKFHIMGMI